MSEPQYAGFRTRTGASIIDSILVMIIVMPVLTLIYGKGCWLDESFIKGGRDISHNYLLPAVAIVIFWISRSATPGKMAPGLSSVDARTGGKPGTGQFIGRYLGHYVSALPLLLGLIWIGFDPRNRAGTTGSPAPWSSSDR